MRTRSHSPAPSGPGLSQMALETPRRPRPWTSPARRRVATSTSASPSCSPAAAARSATAASMAERVGRLQVDEVGDRLAVPASNCSGVQVHAERRLGPDDRVPRLGGVEPGRRCVGASAHSRAESSGSNCEPARLSASAMAASHAADAVGDLDELGELRQPRRDRDRVAAAVRRASPCRPTARTRRRPPSCTASGSPSCSASAARERGVLLDHPVEVAVAVQRELEPDPEPVQRWVPAADQAACVATAPRRLPNSWSYLPDFSAMSSPNHLACSWASAWHPTLTSSAV